MERVPNAGYKIIGLDIVGFQRRLTLSNFLLPLKIIASLFNAYKIIKNFKPQVVIGVGGYASGPTLQAATFLKVPTLVQEQNSFPGKTNKILSNKVTKLCTAYEGLEKFFPKDKIVLTGNPVRKSMVEVEGKREDAFQFYGLDSAKKTILVIGGSLGARTLNESVLNYVKDFQKEEVQILWQGGKFYFESLSNQLKNKDLPNVKMVQFIDRMDFAYALADVIISRAGAISVSELCLVKKPVILVPSPNVAEDHQTKNAMALVNSNAAILVKDNIAKQELIPTAFDLLKNDTLKEELCQEIAKLAKPNATADIVNEIQKII